jgi:hypothetical protein
MENNNIFKTGVRILRPSEIKKIINAIPKADFKDKFEALLFTGMRYHEIRWLFKHKERFSGSTILMPSFKPKAKHKERYIRLNDQGKRAVDHFLRSKKNFPARDGWNANLRRWCKQAGINDQGISTKTTRKTWESWLVTMYPTSSALIFLSQGHTDLISIEYYLMLPFNDQDKLDMKEYTDGWI